MRCSLSKQNNCTPRLLRFRCWNIIQRMKSETIRTMIYYQLTSIACLYTERPSNVPSGCMEHYHCVPSYKYVFGLQHIMRYNFIYSPLYITEHITLVYCVFSLLRPLQICHICYFLCFIWIELTIFQS